MPVWFFPIARESNDSHAISHPKASPVIFHPRRALTMVSSATGASLFAAALGVGLAVKFISQSHAGRAIFHRGRARAMLGAATGASLFAAALGVGLAVKFISQSNVGSEVIRE